MTKKLIVILLLSVSSVFYSFQNCSKNLKAPDLQLDTLKKLEAELTPVVESAFEEIKVPGAIIGVWMGGYEPWKLTLGVADLKTMLPIMLNDKMRIGSNTKTFTGTVLLKLVDEGKINLTDKLSTYFPDFPNGENITIEQLGNMTSGIYNYSDDSTFEARLQNDLMIAYTPQELIDIAFKHDPNFAPGKGFDYSNTNTILLGEIIEKITGNPLQTEIQNRILNPLGMTNTSFPLNATFPDPHSRGYMHKDSLAAQPTDITAQNPSWAWAAGAMISTLDDLSKYAKPLATGELISSKAQTERLNWSKPITPTVGAWKDKPIRYAFTIADFDGVCGHNGSIPGYNSFIGYIPEKDATVIVLANMQYNKAGLGPADYIARQIVEKIKTM